MSVTEEKPAVRLTMVITLKSGTQVRADVESANIRRDRATGKLTSVDWELNDDPFGSSIGYVDPDEVAAIHYERAPVT